MGKPSYCVLGHPTVCRGGYSCGVMDLKLEPLFSHMHSEQEEPMRATQNAVQSFSQKTPFLFDNARESLIFNTYLPPDSFLKQAAFAAVIVSHLPE